MARPPLYEDLYCARGEMENRIKERQRDLFADRTWRRPCAPTSCGCGFPRWPTFSSARRAASASPTPSSPPPPAPPSARNSLSSARGHDQRAPRQDRLRLRLSMGRRTADRPGAPRRRPQLAGRHAQAATRPARAINPRPTGDQKPVPEAERPSCARLAHGRPKPLPPDRFSARSRIKLCEKCGLAVEKNDPKMFSRPTPEGEFPSR